MPFDKLDKKVQEAADKYSPAYNEDAWLKMEALLDEHMPQNKAAKRKLPLAWIFALLLIVGGGVVMLAVHSWSKRENDNQALNTEKTFPAASNNESNNESNNSNSKKITAIQRNKNLSQKEIAPVNNLHKQVLPSTNAFNKKLKKKSPITSFAPEGVYEANEVQLANKKKDAIIEAAHHDELLITNDFEHQITDKREIDNEKLFVGNISINKSISQNHLSNLPANKKPADKIKSKFSNLFSVNFSAGPDVSAVDVNNIGTVKLLYGAGIGYNFGKRWQIKTGVYAVNKVYDAMPSNYHPPANFWNYYPNLDDVSANCNVIEVPVVLNYILSQQSKQAWFVSAGISSYFMKKETYTYHSKLAPGQYQDKTYTIENKNKHYLSSLRLSAGYEKKFNKMITLSAEPYLNLPLSGVGYGKVKLSSAGLLFSVSVKPFVKR